MPERQLRIVRDSVELGTLPEAEARELLRLGFLKPGDLFSFEGMTDARPLAELETSDAPTEKRSWLGTVRESVTSAAVAAACSAESVAGRLKAVVMTPAASLSAATSKLLDGYTGQIKSILATLADSGPMRAIRSGVRDDETMRKVFGAAYDCLPQPVYRFVSEERFIAYCMQHRARLLDLPETPKSDG